MPTGTSCLGGVTGYALITVNSLSLTVSGGSLTVKGNETEVIGGVEPDGAPESTHTTQTLSLSATCTKQ
jgi:hypothetical protein